MGYLTTITIRNDGCADIEPNAEEFAKKIYKACCIGTNPFEIESLGGHCNLIIPQKPRHADDHTLYIHARNDVLDVSNINENNCSLDMLNIAIHEMNYQLKRLRSLKKSLKCFECDTSKPGHKMDCSKA